MECQATEDLSDSDALWADAMNTVGRRLIAASVLGFRLILDAMSFVSQGPCRVDQTGVSAESGVLDDNLMSPDLLLVSLENGPCFSPAPSLFPTCLCWCAHIQRNNFGVFTLYA
ncbi:hypothetical protein LDENG_00010910 [Lucifuga dentata]|nr:hypothetical protein LDENG_00010910 [Lucifuga dentata]